jgi:hypothetical protein
MSDEELHYDVMVEEALRSVVRKALTHVSRHGLPGEHHFYITFRTDAPGVQIPKRLSERYPDEMTIVLQHQFWDLLVGEESFDVTLSFNDVREVLSIPYEAVTAFADPSVKFGLQFGEMEEPEGLPADGEPLLEPESAGEEMAPIDSEAEEAEQQGDNVVALDRFRKRTSDS